MNERKAYNEVIVKCENDNQSFVEDLLHQERLYRRVRIMSAVVAIVVSIGIFKDSVANAVGLDSCGMSKKTPEYLPYCYTEDEFNEMYKKHDIFLDFDDEKLIDLKLSPSKNQLDVVPNHKPGFAEIVEGSTVKITSDEGSGTGFVVEDKNHDKVIATAAHVVLGDKNTMHVITADNKMLEVDSGCMIHEESKHNLGMNVRYTHVVSDVNSKDVKPFDVAILRVKKPEELSNPLPLTNNLVRRGEILYVNNYQIKEDGRGAKIDEPSNFYMITGDTEVGNIETIDGLEVKENVPGDYACDRTMAGGSGGPAFNLRGEVVGLAYGAGELKSYRSAENLKSLNNFIMTEEDNLLVKPGHSTYSDAKTIKQALESPVLYK